MSDIVISPSLKIIRRVKTVSYEQKITPQSQFPARAVTPARTAKPVAEHLIIEDGWVFREHHGKYVECICRSDEAFGQDKRSAPGH